MEASFRKASDVVATLLNRRSGGQEAHTLEAPEPALPRDWPEKLPFRKRPKPYARAIAWTPASDSAPHAADRPYELFVAQSVLREVRQHLITATSGAPFGFLIGQVVYCPWRETPYIVVDSVRRETQNLPPSNEVDRFRQAWVAATRDARHRRGEVIGWYHRHGILGLRLSEWDLRIQEEFFPEAWHCALVIASTSGGIVGGFIQRSRRARLFRKGLAPFRELVELDAKLVDGRKPSCVDWENYAAGEAVSVIRAKWPAAATRAKRWKTENHGIEATLPTTSESIAMPGAQAREKGSLGGRSWMTRAGPARPVAPPEPSEPVAEEDFADAIGAATTDVVYESEEAIDSGVTPAKKSGGRRKPAAKKPSAAERRPAAETPTEEPTTRPADEKSDEDGAWYSADFLDAVGGPVPFEPEESEDGAAGIAATEDARRPDRPTFELVPPFDPEPPEADEPGSIEWLLSLIGDTLARKQRHAPAQEPVEEPLTEGPEEAVPAEPVAQPTEPVPTPRPTFVTASSDPESDPEASIPVVLFHDDTGWRPSERQKRVASALVVLTGAAIALQTFIVASDPDPVPPQAVASPVTPSTPPSEFVQIVDDYLSGLQAYRERFVEHRLGQADCAQLTDNLLSLGGAHGILESYVTGRPDLADRFEIMDAEYLAARQRFEGSGCEAPPELGSARTPPPADETSGPDAR